MIDKIIGTPFEGHGKLDKNGCWVCTHKPNNAGYTSIWYENKRQLIHRASWKYFRGEIPEGHTIDHDDLKCKNKLCFNPEHLSPCTQLENTNRWQDANTRQTPFPCGHSRSPENSASNGKNSVGNPSLRCRICNRRGPRKQKALTKGDDR